MQPPTLRDVADAAGVHPATASRALNPGTRGLVNAETARRVMRAAETLGYRPNPIARSLKTARSGTIGIVLPDLTNPLFPPVVRGIDDGLERAGYTGLIVSTDNDPKREAAQVELLRSRQVEGLIVATALLDHPLMRKLHRDGTLLVMVNRRVEGLDVPSITADDTAGIEMAVRHLADLGHTRIAHLSGPTSTSTGLYRARSFRAAIAECGLAEDPALMVTCSHWSEEAGAAALVGLLDSGADFTAVVAGNDLIALGCYDVFALRGIECPRDMSVVGFNDMPFLDKLAPPLTTLTIPHHQIGVEAARLMLDSIADPSRPARSVTLPLTFAERGSTGPVVGH